MRLKKILGVFVISIILIILGTTDSAATLELNQLDFDARINSDGSMDVTETWNIYISETNTLYKTFKRDSSKYEGLTNISVREITDGQNRNFRNSSTWKYHMDEDYYFGGINNDNEYEIAWGVGLDNSSDTRVYEISYTVVDAINKYNDCAELYWQFIGDEFEVSADKITGTIKLPYNIEDKEDFKVWGHTKYLNGEINLIDNETVKFNIDNYSSREYVEVRLLMPTSLFYNIDYTSFMDKEDEIVEEEAKWAEEANARRAKREKTMQITMVIITAIVGLIGIFFVSGIRKNLKKIKENPKIKPNVKLEYYRELPGIEATPLEASFMITKGVFDLSKVISATILDLTLKEYIKVEQKEKTIKIQILENDISKLPKDELCVLDLLKNAKRYKESKKKETTEISDIITMKDLEKYVKAKPEELTKIQKAFQKIAKETAEQKENYKEKIAKQGATFVAKTLGYIFLIIGVAFSVIFGIAFTATVVPDMIKYTAIAGGFTEIVLLINTILTSILSARFHGFTSKGIEENEQWKAFKKYMEDFSLLNEKEVPALVIWEKYLVFATAFGIADKVIKQLKVKYPELNDNSVVNNMILFSAMNSDYGLNTNFISSLNTSMSHVYSSGSGSGGGFSGGGGGRRPVEAEAADANSKKSKVILIVNVVADDSVRLCYKKNIVKRVVSRIAK